MSLENIVRPFQNNGVFSARSFLGSPSPVPPADATDEPDDPKLLWNGSADGQYVLGPEPLDPSFSVEENGFKEDRSERVTTKVRVENPDDPEQYVEVERIDKMVFKKKVSSDGISLDRIESFQVSPDWDAERS